MGRSSSSPAPGRARRGSSSSACGGCSRRREDLLPEQILVLTYNVKAARELQDAARRRRSGAAIARADVGLQLPQLLPPDPDRERRATPGCRRARTCSTASARCSSCATSAPSLRPRSTTPNWAFPGFVAVHQPGQGRAGHARRLRRLRRRGAARLRGAHTGASTPPSTGSRRRATSGRCARSAAPTPGCAERARRGARRDAGLRPRPRPTRPPTARPAGRSPATGRGRMARAGSPPRTTPQIDALAATYVVDGAALEVVRLTRAGPRLPRLRGRARRRGALDFGEQIAARHHAVQDPPEHPAPLAAPVPLHPGRRVPGRQRRPDRADRAARPDAGPARQRHGRRRRRPVDLSLPGRQLRRLRRVRRAVLAAAHARPRRPTPPGPPPRLRIEQNFRSVGHVLTAANRLIGNNETRYEPDKRLTTDRADGAPDRAPSSAPAPRTRPSRSSTPSKSLAGEGTGRTARPTSPSCIASTSTATRSSARLRDEDIPYTVVGGLSLFETPEIRDLEQGLRAIAEPARRRRAGPDDDRRSVAARCARDPARHPDGQVRSGAPARDRQAIVASGQVEVDVVNERREDGDGTRRSTPRR